MRKNPYPGLFVDIEGLDGAGASTQISLLEQRILGSGRLVYATKEPTQNIIGGLIRGMLKGVWHSESPELIQLLFAADRAHHLEEEIIPNLKEKTIVLTDRYFWSSIAYGGSAGIFDYCAAINRPFFAPDLTIILKISPKVCTKRLMASRFDYELFEKEETLRKCWENYERIAQKWPKLISFVDGEKNPEEVSNQIYSLIEKEKKFQTTSRSKQIKLLKS